MSVAKTNICTVKTSKSRGVHVTEWAARDVQNSKGISHQDIPAGQLHPVQNADVRAVWALTHMPCPTYGKLLSLCEDYQASRVRSVSVHSQQCALRRGATVLPCNLPTGQESHNSQNSWKFQRGTSAAGLAISRLMTGPSSPRENRNISSSTIFLSAQSYCPHNSTHVKAGMPPVSSL